MGLLAAVFWGCHANRETITVAATPSPHADLLEAVKGVLKDEGVELKIVQVDDYNLPNRMLEEKQVDANFFQHKPFLEESNRLYGYHLVPLTAVHIEPLGIYSMKYKSLDSLPTGATVAIPQDPTNETRALELLRDLGWIKLKERPNTQLVTIFDVIDNPKGLRFQELDAPYLPRALMDVDVAIIPTNFALQVKLDPRKDALALESKETPYANIIVIRAGEEERPAFQKLREAMHSEQLRDYMQKKYHGAILPATPQP